MNQEPERRLVPVYGKTRCIFRQALANAGFDTGKSETPIAPGDGRGRRRPCHRFSRELFEDGVYCTGIGYPTVPQGKARIRTIVTATHTAEMLDRAVETLAKVAKKLGILR